MGCPGDWEQEQETVSQKGWGPGPCILTPPRRCPRGTAAAAPSPPPPATHGAGLFPTVSGAFDHLCPPEQVKAPRFHFVPERGDRFLPR